MNFFQDRKGDSGHPVDTPLPKQVAAEYVNMMLL